LFSIYATNLRGYGLYTRAQHHPSRFKGDVCFFTREHFYVNELLFSVRMQPENILCLTESGNRIKIIDFGLAREYDPSTKLQVLFGTPEFG
jgi:serine/threonine protein kinase